MSGTFELRHLRAFVAVAEELNFSRAARKLHLAQQALSAQVRQLEHDLGVQLFYRTTRKVELTQAGRTLLSHALPILTSVATATQQTRRAYSGESGQLSIAYTTTVAVEALPKIILEIRRSHPDLKLQTCEMWQADSVTAVNEGRFDVGLARCPSLRGDLQCISIRDEPLGIIIGTSNHLVAHDLIHISDLANETLTIWPRSLSPGFYDRVVETLRAHSFNGSIHEFENLGSDVLFSDTAAKQEVASGQAFSVSFYHQYFPVPDGFAWRPLEPTLLVPLHMFWKSPASSTVSKLIEVAREVSVRESWLQHARPPSQAIGQSNDASRYALRDG